MFTRVPSFIIGYNDLIEQFDFKFPKGIFKFTIGDLGFIHDADLSDLLFYKPTIDELTRWININHSMVRSVLTSMGVYHNPNLRGKKQWTCNLRLNNVKSVTTHETYEEACEQLKRLKGMVANGTFIQSFERTPYRGLKFGPCTVDEGSDGERCTKANVCELYDHCLSEAWDYDIKGWRISDTTK